VRSNAAERLGRSPTKADYESLGVTPSASTILRVVGGWNEAKRRAGLETNPSTGSRVKSKPDGVALPEGTDWEDLTQDQRWHYNHVEENTERTHKRRKRLRTWVNDQKADRGCAACGESDPVCLQFHHPDPESKTASVGAMISDSVPESEVRAEVEQCVVLCANCHRKEHVTLPDGPVTGT